MTRRTAVRFKSASVTSAATGLRASVLVRVILDIAFRFEISEEVENLILGKSIEQTDGHRRGGLRMALLNVRFI